MCGVTDLRTIKIVVAMAVHQHWMQRIGNQGSQPADKQPFKIKQINRIYGQTEAFNRKGSLGSKQNMENWDCSVYLCASKLPLLLVLCRGAWLTLLSRAALPLLFTLAHSGFCEQGWKPPEFQRWDLQAATWACHLLQMSLPDGWADAAWNKETIIFAPGWVL